MLMGDVLVKLTNPTTPLSQVEKRELRLWGNQSQGINSFVNGLQNGQSELRVSSVYANRVFSEKETLSGLAGRFLDATKQISSSTMSYAEFVEDYNDGYPLGDLVSGAGGGYREIEIPETGTYVVGFSIVWETNATGIRDAAVLVNGVLGSSNLLRDNRMAVTSVSFETMLGCSHEDNYEKGDVLKLRVYQDSGSTLYMAARLFIRKLR